MSAAAPDAAPDEPEDNKDAAKNAPKQVVAGTAPVSGRRTARILAVAAVGYLGAAFLASGLHAVTTVGVGPLIAALAILAALAVISRIRFRGDIALVLVATLAAQLIWGVVVAPFPFGELGLLWDQARRIALDGEVAAALSSPSPGAALFYGVAMAGLGDDLATLRVITALLWTLQTWLVWRIAGEIAELRKAALGAATAFGLAPSTIVVGGLISPYAVFGAAALASIYVLLSHRRRGLFVSVAMSGALAGLAVLARPSGLAFLVATLLVLTIAVLRATNWRPRRRLLLALLATLAGFMATIGPYAAFSVAQEGRLTFGPTGSLGFQLMVGANRETARGYSLKDLEDAGYIGPNATSPAEANAAAFSIGVDRIARDPIGFFGFAMTEKIHRLWASDGEILNWSLSGPDAPLIGAEASWLDANRIALLRTASDGALLALLLAGALAAVRIGYAAKSLRDPSRWIMVFGALLVLAAFHAVLEARETHQLVFAPLLALLAPVPLTRLSIFRRLNWLAERMPRLFSRDPDAPEAAPGGRARAEDDDDLDPDDAKDPFKTPVGDTPGTKTRTAPVRS